MERKDKISSQQLLEMLLFQQLPFCLFISATISWFLSSSGKIE
jgi:hypothetical protein